MATQTGAESLLEGPFVVHWRAGRKRFFSWYDDWSTARYAFEAKTQELNPGANVDRLGVEYRCVRPRGGVLLERRGLPAGLSHAIRRGDAEPDLFALLRVRDEVVPVLGSASVIDAFLTRASNAGGRIEVKRYAPAPVLADHERRPASRMLVTPAGQLAAVRIADTSRSAEALLQGLAVEELIFVCQKLRDDGHHHRAHDVAAIALRRKRTPDTLNLCASVLRDGGAYDRSEALLRESIEMCPSAEANPYAYVILAATLRRMDRSSEGWDLIKKPRRHFPGDSYVQDVYEALRRDLGLAPPRRRSDQAA